MGVKKQEKTKWRRRRRRRRRRRINSSLYLSQKCYVISLTAHATLSLLICFPLLLLTRNFKILTARKKRKKKKSITKGKKERSRQQWVSDCIIYNTTKKPNPSTYINKHKITLLINQSSNRKTHLYKNHNKNIKNKNKTKQKPLE